MIFMNKAKKIQCRHLTSKRGSYSTEVALCLVAILFLFMSIMVKFNKENLKTITNFAAKEAISIGVTQDSQSHARTRIINSINENLLLEGFKSDGVTQKIRLDSSSFSPIEVTFCKDITCSSVLSNSNTWCKENVIKVTLHTERDSLLPTIRAVSGDVGTKTRLVIDNASHYETTIFAYIENAPVCR